MEGTEDGQHTVDRKTVGSTKKKKLCPKLCFVLVIRFIFGLEMIFNASGRI